MKKGGTSAGGALHADLPLALRDTMARLGKPASPSELRKALPKPYQRPVEEITRVLEKLARERSIFSIRDGKALKYCDHDPSLVLRQAVTVALREGPLSKADLTARVKRAAPGFEKVLAASLPDLVRRGDVREHPKVGTQRTTRYGLAPPDATPFLAKTIKDLRALQKKLAPTGLTSAALFVALGRALGLEGLLAQEEASDDDDDDAVLAALHDLASREPPGSLLSVRALRAMRPLSKARFDRAVLKLSADRKVVLHHHDFPASLQEAERADLVLDERGVHYVGIAPRGDA